MNRLDPNPRRIVQPHAAVRVVHILQHEYPLFLAGLIPDRRLPGTYEEWQRESTNVHKFHRAARFNTERVTILWADFSAYVTRIGQKPRYALLSTYAAAYL
jgi:hypothetical protein